jgi:hypothetical protein
MALFDRTDPADDDRDDWFVPKAFGIGATPVTWQGWALTLALCGLLVADVELARSSAVRIGLMVALFAAFLPIVALKTRGGLGWHWGDRS